MKKIEDILKKLYKDLKLKTIFKYLVVTLIIGYVLNVFWSHKNFYVNQYILIIMWMIQIFVLKKIDLENDLLEDEIKKRKEMVVWGSFHSRTQQYITPMHRFVISCVFISIYIVSMFKLGCLECTPTGVYGGVLGAIVFATGIQAYLKYLELLSFAQDLKKISVKNYFFYFPALTDWIVRLAHEFSYIEKWFLILGLMYSTMYAINLPSNVIIFKNGNLRIQTSSKALFIITWGGIIIFFALAVPVFTFLSRYFIKGCISKCKGISIKSIEKQIQILSASASETDLSIIQKKLSLIKMISDSEEYPLKYSHTIFENFYTFSLALLTLVSPFMSMIQPFIIKN